MDLYKMTAWQIIVAGGPMMWPILLCSVVAIGLIAERFWYLHTIRFDTQAFLTEILDKVKRNQIKDALVSCDKIDNPLSRILKAGILRYDRSRSQLKEAIEDASLYEIPKLEKNLSALATIAHVSPLLGLLGTATGLVRAFQMIQSKASAFAPIAPNDLAAGIWEALLTTVAGLLVAIPAFVSYNYLVSRVNTVIVEMEKAGTELVNCLTE